MPLTAVIEASGQSRFEWLLGARKREYAWQLLGLATAAKPKFGRPGRGSATAREAQFEGLTDLAEKPT